MRAIQLTLVAVALVLWWFGWSAFQDIGTVAARGSSFDPQPPSTSDVVALAIGGATALVIAALMGVRAVRGPRPPEI